MPILTAGPEDIRTAIDGLPPLREVIATAGLRAEKALGQNFLLDLNLTDKIVLAARITPQDHVFEIGPGPGGMTRAILKQAPAAFHAIELDPRAEAALKPLEKIVRACNGPDFYLHQADALTCDLCALAPKPRKIIANLPYNIATPLLIGWLRQIRADADAFSGMTLMFQKEVADRILAVPGEKAYGRLSVIAQWLCDISRVTTLPPAAFTPPPKILSSVLHFRPHGVVDPEAPAFETVEKITAAAFGQRRKMLRGSLKSLGTDILTECNIDPTLRAEDLPVCAYITMARRMETILPHP